MEWGRLGTCFHIHHVLRRWFGTPALPSFQRRSLTSPQCGMLVESTKVRDLLSTTVAILPARTDIHPTDAEALRATPKTYNFSMNPMPGLIILLLGIMMSSHHQTSMVSTMVHNQWGTLFIGFALARAVTYILFFLSPPTSVFASRPPSELVSSFCLISGGLIFMASVS